MISVKANELRGNSPGFQAYVVVAVLITAFRSYMCQQDSHFFMAAAASDTRQSGTCP